MSREEQIEEISRLMTIMFSKLNEGLERIDKRLKELEEFNKDV